MEPAGFTGKEADEEIGLVYFGERYLIPRVGRWANADPLHVHAAAGGQSLNAYHYVAGNLLAARDPMGLCPAGVTGDACLQYEAALAMMGEHPLSHARLQSEIELNTPEWLRETMRESVEGAVLGDAIEDPTWTQIAGQVGAGFTPAGVVGDVRDIGVNAHRGDVGGTVLSAVGLVPGFGDLFKALVRSGSRAALGVARLTARSEVIIGTYERVSAFLAAATRRGLRAGAEGHHLMQDAAFGFRGGVGNIVLANGTRVGIATADGLAITLHGNPNIADTAHHAVHHRLEQFWNQFRRGGSRAGTSAPATVGEYNAALRSGLGEAGLTRTEVDNAMNQVLEQQARHGITPDAQFVEVPGPVGVAGGVSPRERP